MILVGNLKYIKGKLITELKKKCQPLTPEFVIDPTTQTM